MGSLLEYERTNGFDSSVYHSSYFSGGSSSTPLDASTHGTMIECGNLGGPDAPLQSMLMPQAGGWGPRDVAHFAARWPMHHPDLHLSTSFALEDLDTKLPAGLLSSNDETIHSGSCSSDVSINPAQLSGGDPSSPAKRSSHMIPSSDAPKRHKRIKSTLKAAPPPSLELESANEDADEKREKFLARNRVAASKCRQKKKEWTGQLEDKARELSKQRNYLTATVNMLRNELLELKCRCLEHSDCDCGRIRDYLKSTVAALSPTSSLYYDSTMTNTSTSLDVPRRPSANSVASLSWSDQVTASPEENSDASDS